MLQLNRSEEEKNTYEAQRLTEIGLDFLTKLPRQIVTVDFDLCCDFSRYDFIVLIVMPTNNGMLFENTQTSETNC